MPTPYAELLDTLREEASYGLDLAFLDDDARMIALLRRSADAIAREAEVYDGAVLLIPVVGQSAYRLDGSAFSRPVERVLRVRRDGREMEPVRPAGMLGTVSTAMGTVRDLYAAPDELLLSPPPSVEEAARLWRVEALVRANVPLADGSNATGLPDELVALVTLGALQAAKMRSTESEQFARLRSAEEEVREGCRRYRARSRRDRYALPEPGARRVVR